MWFAEEEEKLLSKILIHRWFHQFHPSRSCTPGNSLRSPYISMHAMDGCKLNICNHEWGAIFLLKLAQPGTSEDELEGGLAVLAQ